MEIFILLLITLIGGLLVRADGWGANATDPKWLQKISSLFNVWSCSALFGLLILTISTPLLALASASAFFIWRLPGFYGWEKWLNMFWRGLWTSATGFVLLSLAKTGTPDLVFLSLPFSILYMCIYSGGYKFFSTFKYIHNIIEIMSGVVFTAFILFII